MASNATDDANLKSIIEESLQYRSLQARIPPDSVTVTCICLYTFDQMNYPIDRSCIVSIT